MVVCCIVNMIRYCMVLFAGIAAEALVYGEAEGGENDENLFRNISVLLEPPLSVVQVFLCFIFPEYEIVYRQCISTLNLFVNTFCMTDVESSTLVCAAILQSSEMAKTCT